MKRILITNASSRHNRGDSAILSSQIKILKKLYPKANVRVLSLDPHSELDRRGAIFKESLIYWAIFRKTIPQYFIVKLLRFGYIVTVVPTVAVLSRLLGSWILHLLPGSIQKILEEYRYADLVTPIGGGYLRSNKNTLRATFDLVVICQEILYGKIFSKPVVLFPASFGPFASIFHAYGAAIVLHMSDHIFIREQYSYDLALEYVDKSKVSRVGDLAFLSTATYKKTGHSQLVVGVTVRNWLKPKLQADFEQALANFIDSQPDISFIFLPQVTSICFDDDDRRVAERVFRLIKRNKQVTLINRDLSVGRIKQAIANCDVFIGMRMHSNIFALTQAVPVIALAYEYKTLGIMDDFGFSQWVLPVEQLDSKKLTQLFSQLKTAQKRQWYRQQIMKKLPEYRKHTLNTIHTVLQQLEKHRAVAKSKLGLLITQLVS